MLWYQRLLVLKLSTEVDAVVARAERCVGSLSYSGELLLFQL
jgi:hypothetical protein